MDALILLVAFLVFMFIGIPVAYAMGLATLVTALWIDIPLEAVMIAISDGMSKFALLTIPFFVLAGAIMSEGGVARRLVDLAKVFVGFIRGGLALLNVLASTLFGCLSGSSVADTASIGSVMIPETVRHGYSKVFATNVTICGSVQAILVPPSHNSIIYSIATGGTVSIAALFMAGVFPGLLFGACLIGLILWKAGKENFPTGRVVPLREALKIPAAELLQKLQGERRYIVLKREVPETVALALKDELIRDYAFKQENITLLTDDKATEKNIRKALSSFANLQRVTKEDRLLIFFSGHGQSPRPLTEFGG